MMQLDRHLFTSPPGRTAGQMPPGDEGVDDGGGTLISRTIDSDGLVSTGNFSTMNLVSIDIVC